MNTAQSQERTFRDEIADATILFIFGASGDLSRRKLMPALYHLSREDLLPNNFKVFGLGRRIPETGEFRDMMQQRVIQYCSHSMEDRFWKPLSTRMESMQGADINNDSTFENIISKINEVESLWGRKANKLFFLATSPSHFDIIIKKMIQYGLNKQGDDWWTRVVIEKPFGLTLKMADTLNHMLSDNFRENQIFRVDHYLGKEAVQNLLIFRMSNIMFQPLWNKEYIDHIQITTSETIGVGGRVEFFEQTGAILDMVQSHLLQVLALLTMEHPASLDPESIRDEKVILFRSIRKYQPNEVADNIVRGQYDEGVVKSHKVVSYREESIHTKDSLVDTYIALRLFIDNPRWRDVPIYIRTGKRMPERKTEIYIKLKTPSSGTVPIMLKGGQQIRENSITFEIQPRSGINIQLGWRPAGLLADVSTTYLTISGKPPAKEPKAYERLIVDAIRGDNTLFIRHDEIHEMFKVVEPFMEFIRSENKKIRAGELEDPYPNYHAGTQGPEEADKFIERDGRKWRLVYPIDLGYHSHFE